MPEIGVNKVILIGRTGADAEIKYTSSDLRDESAFLQDQCDPLL